MSGTGSAEPAIIRLRLLQKPSMERVWRPYEIHTHVSDAGASFSRSVYQTAASCTANVWMLTSAANRDSAAETSRMTASASVQSGWKSWPHSIVKPSTFGSDGSAQWRL